MPERSVMAPKLRANCPSAQDGRSGMTHLDTAREIPREGTKLVPIRVLIVACRVCVASGLRHDPLHDPLLQPVVLGVRHRPGHRPCDERPPSAAVQKPVQYLLDFLPSFGALLQNPEAHRYERARPPIELLGVQANPALDRPLKVSDVNRGRDDDAVITLR